MLKKYQTIRALLWKDWKQTWPSFVGLAAFVTWATTLSFLFGQVAAVQNRIELRAGLVGAVPILFVIWGAISLGQEREKGTLALLLSMGYARRDILLSKFLVGLSQICLAFIGNAVLLTSIMWASRGVSWPFSVAAVWGHAAHYIIVLTFVLCVTLLASAITGRALGGASLALLLLLLPAGAYAFGILHGAVWEQTGLLPGWVESWYWYWNDLIGDVARYLFIPTWLMDFPGVLATHSVGYIERVSFDRVAANILWYFLRELPLVLYATVIGLSIAVYTLAQHSIARNQLECDGELLAVPSLRPVVKLGLVALIVTVPGLWLVAFAEYLVGLMLVGQAHSILRLGLMVLFYVVSALFAWIMVGRLLDPRRNRVGRKT